jgi:hypothetical protein
MLLSVQTLRSLYQLVMKNSDALLKDGVAEIQQVITPATTHG